MHDRDLVRNKHSKSGTTLYVSVYDLVHGTLFLGFLRQVDELSWVVVGVNPFILSQDLVAVLERRRLLFVPLLHLYVRCWGSTVVELVSAKEPGSAARLPLKVA
jgi:hypothetical protein